MSRNPTLSPRRLVLLLATVALLLKLYCAGTTFGTNDVMLCCGYGQYIARHGLSAAYLNIPIFNHTPLIGELFRFLCRISSPDYALFPFYLRLPGIVADFLVVLALIRFHDRTGRPPWWALALFAASPVSFMVSGYHGNIDSILVLFLVLAACASAENRPLFCALFFGLACNIKISAILLSPVFFFFWLHRKQAPLFFLATSVVALLGWLPALLSVPGVFLKNVFGYSSYWGIWGITYWLRLTPFKPFQQIICLGFTPAQATVTAVLKLTVITAVLVLAWRRRTEPDVDIFSSLALAWIVFFVFAPGVCAQYLIWLAPFVLVFSPRWYLALTAASSVFLFIFYNTLSGGIPWYLGVSKHSFTLLWSPWSNVPWAVLIACLVYSWKKWTPRTRNAPQSCNP